MKKKSKVRTLAIPIEQADKEFNLENLNTELVNFILTVKEKVRGHNQSELVQKVSNETQDIMKKTTASTKPNT